MEHDRIREELPLYATDDLEPERRVVVAAHLAACEECARELATLERTLGLLGQIAETADPGVDLSGVDGLAPALPRSRPVARWSLRAAALAAAFLAGVAVQSARQPDGRPQAGRPVVVRPPEPANAEQRLERAYQASRKGTDQFSRSLLGLSALMREEQPR